MLRPFAAALPIIAHDWKQPKCPTTGSRRINCYIHALEFHEVAEGNEEEYYILLWRERQETLLKDKRKKAGQSVYIMLPCIQEQRVGE